MGCIFLYHEMITDADSAVNSAYKGIFLTAGQINDEG